MPALGPGLTLGAMGVVKAWHHPPRGGAWARGPQAAHNPPKAWAGGCNYFPLSVAREPVAPSVRPGLPGDQVFGLACSPLRTERPHPGHTALGQPLAHTLQDFRLWVPGSGRPLPLLPDSFLPTLTPGRGVWELLWDAPLSPQPFHSPTLRGGGLPQHLTW